MSEGNGDGPAPPQMTPDEQQQLLARTVYGSMFNPQPFSWSAMRGHLNRPDGGKQSVLFLTFEHAHGRFSVPVTDSEAAEMGRKLIEQSTGLVLPP